MSQLLTPLSTGYVTRPFSRPHKRIKMGKTGLAMQDWPNFWMNLTRTHVHDQQCAKHLEF